ncbi:hypothetical protein PanWU01x14_292260, partial [Parasponia andersonii]
KTGKITKDIMDVNLAKSDNGTHAASASSSGVQNVAFNKENLVPQCIKEMQMVVSKDWVIESEDGWQQVSTKSRKQKVSSRGRVRPVERRLDRALCNEALLNH